MNTSMEVNCAWNENTCHQRALRRVIIFTEKEKRWDKWSQFSWSNILIDPCKSIWSKLLLSNLVSCFFQDYDIFQSTWIHHGCGQDMKNIQITINSGSLMQKCYVQHTEWHSLSRWVTARLLSSERTKSTVALKEHRLWWGCHHHTHERCLNTSYTLSISLKTLPIWTGHQHNSNSRERSVSILVGRKLCHSNK